MAVITTPPPESSLVGVALDDRAAGGLYLPSPLNNARKDAERTRASLIMIGNLLGTSLSESQARDLIDTRVAQAVASIINSAPGALDTLDELAAALGDDPNFAATVTNQFANIATAIGLLAPKANPVFTGAPKVPTAAITTNDTTAASTEFVRSLLAALDTVASARVKAPTRSPGDNGTDVATTAFVVAGFLALAGGTLTGAVKQTAVNLGTLTGAVTINAANRNVFTAAINGAVPITISNLPADNAQTIELSLSYTSGSISFADTINWNLGGAQKSTNLADTGLSLVSGGLYNFAFWKNGSAIQGVVS